MPHGQALLLTSLLACLLSACFLAGYDQHARDGMDAGEAGIVPVADADTREAGGDAGPVRDGGRDAGASDAAVDARADGAARDTGVADSALDANTKPDTGTAADAGQQLDTGSVPEADATVDGPDADTDADPDAGLDPDAGDASRVELDGSTTSDAGNPISETSVGDAGSDACGPSGRSLPSPR